MGCELLGAELLDRYVLDLSGAGEVMPTEDEINRSLRVTILALFVILASLAAVMWQ